MSSRCLRPSSVQGFSVWWGLLCEHTPPGGSQKPTGGGRLGLNLRRLQNGAWNRVMELLAWLTLGVQGWFSLSTWAEGELEPEKMTNQPQLDKNAVIPLAVTAATETQNNITSCENGWF